MPSVMPSSVYSKKKEEFREAAREMLDYIPTLARIPELRCPDFLKVRPGLFSMRVRPVPSDVKQWASDHIRPILAEKLQRIVEGVRDDFGKAYANSLYRSTDLAGTFYENSKGLDFYVGLDEEKVVALGKNGVVLTVLQGLSDVRMDDDVRREIVKSVGWKEDHLWQRRRAVVPTFKDMAMGVMGNIEVGRYSVIFPLMKSNDDVLALSPPS